MTLASDTTTAPAPGAEMTPQQYGVGARFTLSVYDSDYVRIIMEALGRADRSGLTIETTDISTFVGGTEQRVLEFLRDVIGAAAASGVHISAAILLSRGCPGELACALPVGVSALGAEPITLAPVGVRARAHWSLYPLLDGGSEGDHMSPIYAAIEDAKAARIYAGSDHFATRLDGDLAAVLATAANGWIGVGGVVQHVTTHLTVSLNSPTPPTP
ncbi:YkoF family thiamine/hydroxymethylpyrimidine-binding protein [Leucobacter chromiireducens]|uniref:YkoF family thiamine/hydroxymethylpyrimidine-binding protein n=1 Tax=Leucobacter chromiireducens TaxID=283877 RepID=UPI000F639487|nr:YkoF family thiamine/hydroxymethylpyrimidine-binding protein [Leucobacter chromiireducens]